MVCLKMFTAGHLLGLWLLLALMGMIQSQNDGSFTLDATGERLARQIMMMQLAMEERVRSEGASGLKQTRVVNMGMQPYHADSFSGTRVCAMHEHANHVMTAGSGEFIAVLNGVEFRTRHNDFRIAMPSRTSSQYHETEDIPYPDVPPAVTAKTTVAGQVDEMKQWFKAWKDQDPSVRDYRPYFKPVLCYLEGAWTTARNIQEAFPSDRHSYDAYSWFDLAQKIAYTSYTGDKDSFENYAFLPSTFMELDNRKIYPAQWNYRILCHPLRNDLGTNRFYMVNDLSARLANNMTKDEFKLSRNARFKLNLEDSGTKTHGRKNCDFLDQLMSEVPGVNNYPANFVDNSLGERAMQWNDSSRTINAGYYHRWFKLEKADAMGTNQMHRTFSDENVFMAMTDNEGTAPYTGVKCKKPFYTTCQTYTQRWTYAIPLEIIYLTPLWKWNPHNIVYKGEFNSAAGQTVESNGKDGTPARPYDGSHSKMYYHTPAAFYTGDLWSKDTADTARTSKWVKNSRGQANEVAASGTRIILPKIQGVGKVRTRYPIMSVHQEGSAIWKEVEALKKLILKDN